MNLGQMLNDTGAIDSIARELGVDSQTARMGASVLLPAIVAGMGRDTVGAGGSRAADPGLGGLGGILGGLAGMAGGGSGGGLLDLVLGQQPTPVQQGNDILGQIFGNKDVSRTVADEAAGASGLDSTMLKKMLPLLAMAVVGYLANRGQQTQPGGATGGGAGGALGGLLGALVTGLARGR